MATKTPDIEWDDDIEWEAPAPAAPSPAGMTYSQAAGPTAMPPPGPQGPSMLESGERGLLDIGQGAKQSLYWALEKMGQLPPGTTQRYTESVMPEREEYEVKRLGVTSPDFMRTAANVGPLFAFPQARTGKALTGLASKAGIGSGFSKVLGELGAGEAGGVAAGTTSFTEQPEKKGEQLVKAAVLGGVLPGVGMAGRRMFGKTQTESQRLMAERAKQATPPIPLTPKEEYGGALTPRLEAGLNMTLGGSAAFKGFETKQQQALTANVAAQLRQRTNEFTPEVRQNISNTIGGLYTRALQGKALAPDRQLIEDFRNILREQMKKPEAEQDEFIVKYVMGKGGSLKNPKLDPAWGRPMSAELYNELRSGLGKRAVKSYKSGETYDAKATDALQDALDSWASRRIGSHDPEAVQALAEARRMNRVWMATQKSLDEPVGQINPSEFVKVMERDGGKDAALATLRNLTPVAYNIRQRPFSPIGIGVGTGIAGLLGAGLGMGSGGNDPQSALGGAAASAVLPWLAGALYLNPKLRSMVSIPARGAEQMMMRGAAPITGLFEQ